MSVFPVFGASGRRYEYMPVGPEDTPKSFLWQTPGNFVFFKEINVPAPEMLFAGEAAPLIAALEMWRKIKEKYPNAFMCARVSANPLHREEEVRDLVARYAPEMNK